MKYFFSLFFSLFLLSCNQDLPSEGEVESYSKPLMFKSTSQLSEGVTDFSAQSYENGIRLSWSVNTNQILLKKIDGNKSVNLYRGVNDFFEDVTSDFKNKDSYNYELYLADLDGEYYFAASLVITIDDQNNANIFPVTNINYLMKKGRVIISWSPPSDVEVVGYEILRNGQVIASITTPFFVDESPIYGEINTYEVFSINSVGVRSNSSDDFSITVNRPINDISPVNFIAENNQVSISWEVPDEESFLKTKLFRDGVEIFEDTKGGGEFIDGQVTNYNEYIYYITHFNEQLEEFNSLEYQVMVIDTLPISSVPNFHVDARNNEATIGWEVPDESDFDYFELFKDGVSIYTGAAVSYFDSDVLNGQSVLYEIIAYDTAGNVSVPQALDVVVIDDIPPLPITMAHIEIYDSQLNLYWESEGLEGEVLEIYRSNTPIVNYGEGENIYQSVLNSEDRIFKDLELINGVEYYYGLYVLDAASNASSAFSLNGTPRLEGELDVGFNLSGFSEFAPHGMMMDYVIDQVIDSKGRLLLLWEDYEAQPMGVKIERRFSDGELDLSFAETGQLIFTWDDNLYARSIALNEDDEVYVAGYTYEYESQVLFLAKFGSDGAPVNSFGDSITTGDLVVNSEVDSNLMTIDHLLLELYEVKDIEVGEGNAYLVGGSFDYEMDENGIYVIKVNASSGVLDSNYGSELGVSLINSYPDYYHDFYSELTNNNELYVLGLNGSLNGLYRLLPTGLIDASFNFDKLLPVTQTETATDTNTDTSIDVDNEVCGQIFNVNSLMVDDADDIYINMNCYNSISSTYPKQIHKINKDGAYYSGFGDQGLGFVTYEDEINSNYSRAKLDEQNNIWVVSTAQAEVGNNLKLDKISSNGVPSDQFPVEYVNILGLDLSKNPMDLFIDPVTQKPILFGSKYEDGFEDLFMIRLITKSKDYIPVEVPSQ